jgi:hypothetical protein
MLHLNDDASVILYVKAGGRPKRETYQHHGVARFLLHFLNVGSRGVASHASDDMPSVSWFSGLFIHFRSWSFKSCLRSSSDRLRHIKGLCRVDIAWSVNDAWWSWLVCVLSSIYGFSRYCGWGLPLILLATTRSSSTVVPIVVSLVHFIFTL